jgi:proteasome lid subunit RPN8/RPN11
VRISRAHWDELVAHAREEAPNECCGYMRVNDRSVEEVVRAVNDHRSLFAANELDDAGHGVAIYHSHPRSAGEPSQTDINLAQYPDWTYWIVSLDGEPTVRAWRIADGRVEELPVDVD